MPKRTLIVSAMNASSHGLKKVSFLSLSRNTMPATAGGHNGFYIFNGEIKNRALRVTTGIVACHKQT